MARPADNVVREFSPISKYRVRLLQDSKGNEAIDIREFVQNDQFEGYTRRGIRLTDRAQMDQLRDILTETLSRNGSEPLPTEPVKPSKPVKKGKR